MNTGFVRIFLLSIAFIFSVPSHASNLTMRLDVKAENLTDQISKDDILAVGYIENMMSEKNKLILSSDMEKINGQHSAYIVRGKNNPNHILMVKIGGRGWSPDKEGEGMLYQTDGDASFNVYAYKNSAIYADTYVLSFYAYHR